MASYLIRRLLFSIVVLLVVSVAIFVLMRAIPGDPVTSSQGGAGEFALTKEQLDVIRKDLGLDKSLPEQYFVWLGDLLRGDGGRSLTLRTPTVENLVKAIPVTAQLAIMAAIGGMAIGIPLGILSAVRRNTILDYGSRGFAIAGLSIPDFWIGIMVLVYLAIWFQWTIPFGYSEPWEDPWRNFQQFSIPALILATRSSASTLRFTRGGMLEVLNEDYVRTARAKGLTERTVVLRHALRNALIPVLTVISVQLAYLLGGSVIMETLFTLPGVGKLTIDAVLTRDFTQVQTNVMFFATITVTVNLLVDFAYAAIDPRIRASYQ